MTVTVTFVEVQATRLVEVRSIAEVESTDVSGCLVRLCPVLSVEERRAVDMSALKMRLIDRGAAGVAEVAVMARDEAVVQNIEASDRMALSTAVENYVRASAAAPEVRERAIEIVTSLLGN